MSLNLTSIECVKNPDGVEDKSCIICSHFDVCPLIKLWIELAEVPIEVCIFHCSEFKKQEIPR